ncbi:hypothetical protein OWR29_38865 [Actinoplanes sp. Pm04-4]|uniref:Uncharacterized protein n=1 Tax=Paractinoplanes pyxinae TaxID=2997416 RepID=A0ABT4BBU3_9ACTN|nr:hypothetical protein [Actinoplanes pyxinae]MCY1143994.1 hypothetical protein [Actinoplanes pyxinae]
MADFLLSDRFLAGCFWTGVVASPADDSIGDASGSLAEVTGAGAGVDGVFPGSAGGAPGSLADDFDGATCGLRAEGSAVGVAFGVIRAVLVGFAPLVVSGVSLTTMYMPICAPALGVTAGLASLFLAAAVPGWSAAGLSPEEVPESRSSPEDAVGRLPAASGSSACTAAPLSAVVIVPAAPSSVEA